MILPENKAKAEHKIVAEEKRQNQFLFSTKVKPGHKMWELDVNTKEIKEAEVNRFVIVGKDGKDKKKARVQIKKDCLYMPALNLKNAEKRFKKMGVL